MLIITSVLSLVCGIILCFFGYRSFRAAMAVSGFVIGAAVGLFIDGLIGNLLPGAGLLVRSLSLLLVFGMAVGYLSFKVYKTALFYVTMLFTTFTLLKTVMLSSAAGMGIYSFMRVLTGAVPDTGWLRSVDTAAAPAPLVSGFMGDLLAMLPGESLFDKFWIIIGICFLLGAIAGILACTLQRPAIIIATSIFGGVLITQAVGMLTGANWSGDALMLSLSDTLDSAVIRPEASLVIALVMIGAGLLVQFKTKKNT